MRTFQREGVARGASIGALLFLLLTLAPGCLSIPDHLDLGPFYAETRTRTGSDVRLPFLLSRHRVDRVRGLEELQVLYPLGRFRQEGREWDHRVIPVYYDIGRVGPHGFIDRDWFLLGAFGGWSALEGSYFAVLPFGGTLKGYLGKDEIRVVLFPFYLYQRDKDFHSWHVLWPLINWVAGRGRSGFRVLPFYSHYERQDAEGRPAYERTHVLWPFYTHLRNNLNSDAPTVVWHLWPFWGTSDGPTTHRRTILYPLFRWMWDDAGHWAVRAPFPVLTLAGGPGRGRYDLWPLYGYRWRERGDRPWGEYRSYSRHFFLWPIGRVERTETDRWVDSKLWILPLYWSYHRVWQNELGEPTGERREVKVWPLFRYRSTREGETSVDLLSVIPWQDPEGFESVWGPLFRVFHRYTDETGGHHVKVGWGLYDRWTSPGDRASVTSFLWGMFRWIRRGTDRSLSLLGLPGIPLGGADPAPRDPSTPVAPPGGAE